MHYVYFVGPAGSDGGPIKIGNTYNLPQRVRSLQTACPMPLECFEFIEVDGFNALDLEQCLHRLLQHKRTSGEWFDIKRADVHPVVQMAFNMLGLGMMVVEDHGGVLPAPARINDVLMAARV